MPVLPKFNIKNVLENPEKYQEVAERLKNLILENLIEISDNKEFLSNNPQVNSISKPSEQDLNIINKLTNLNSSSDDWITVCFRASDNLVNRSYRKWNRNILEQMVIKSIDNCLLTDHEWEKTDNSIGFIYKAELVKNSILPQSVRQISGYESINQKIVSKEGFLSVLMYAAIPNIETFKPIIDKITHRVLDKCSTGGRMSNLSLICPNCSEEKGTKVTFTEQDKNGNYVCPHMMPSSWSKVYAEDELEDYKFADYVEYDGSYDSFELSICNIPNLPNAGIER